MASVKPMTNQILAHVSNTPLDLIDYTKSKGLLVEACSPIGHGKILDNAEIAAMARKYGVSVPQLSIRYVLQLGLLPLPKTANPDHMRSNAAVDFEISDADMKTLKNVEPIRSYGDASVFPVYGGKMWGKNTLIASGWDNLPGQARTAAGRPELRPAEAGQTIIVVLLRVFAKLRRT